MLLGILARTGWDFGGAVTKASLFLALRVPDALKPGTSIILQGDPCSVGLLRNIKPLVIIFINKLLIWGNNNPKIIFVCCSDLLK